MYWSFTNNAFVFSFWPLRAEDVKRLSVFDHRCLRSIARIWWEHRISNAEVRRMVFGRNNSPSIDELITLHRLRWLGHVLRMPVDRLPRKVLSAQPREGWKRARGDEFVTLPHTQLLKNIIDERFIWVPGEYLGKPNWFGNEWCILLITWLNLRVEEYELFQFPET
ncbi:hypothetical protein CSKR_112044 [Clonorchis sinensis]|uniref:Uncharacterized protein n=1 Tax=Clonorchis sinensis TaxID=79923 RepID=A0A3R7FMJ0_CLOSI|nr:hypothetical protein CSKR_112044 [Clonorchis sinensis]